MTAPSEKMNSVFGDRIDRRHVVFEDGWTLSIISDNQSLTYSDNGTFEVAHLDANGKNRGNPVGWMEPKEIDFMIERLSKTHGPVTNDHKIQ